MEPNKPVNMMDDTKETYTPGQQAVLNLLQWGAWMAVFIAMLYVMHS